MKQRENKSILQDLASLLASLVILTAVFTVLVSWVICLSYLAPYNALWLLPQFMGLDSTYVVLLFLLLSFFISGPIMLGFLNGNTLRSDINTDEKDTSQVKKPFSVLVSKKKLCLLYVRAKNKLWIIIKIFFILIIISLNVAYVYFDKIKWISYSIIAREIHVFFDIFSFIAILWLYNNLVFEAAPLVNAMINKNKNKSNLSKSGERNSSKGRKPEVVILNIFVYAAYLFLYYFLFKKNGYGSVALIMACLSMPLLLNFLGTCYGLGVEDAYFSSNNFVLVIFLLFISMSVTFSIWPPAQFSKFIMSQLGLGAFHARLICKNSLKLECRGNFFVLANLDKYIYVKHQDVVGEKIFQIPRGDIIAFKLEK